MRTPQPEGPHAPIPGHCVQMLVAQLRDGASALDSGQLLTTALPSLLDLSGAASALAVRLDGDQSVVVARAGRPLDWADDAELLLDEPAHAVPATWAAQGVERATVRRLPGRLGVLVLAWAPGTPSTVAETELGLGLLDASLARLQAEDELRDLTDRVNNAQQLAGMGDYDWHIPTDTNRWSDQLYRIYGHEPQSFNASYDRSLSHLHPDDREQIKEIHQLAYATGEPYNMIERVVRPDGAVRYLSSAGQVLMDEEGNPVRMRGTFVDITERVLADEARERIAARFRSLVDSSPYAIVVADRDGGMLQANRRAVELLGGDPVGHGIAEILPGVEPATATGLETVGLDGRPLRLDVETMLLSDADDDGLRAVFLHDATARLANEALAVHLHDAQLRRRQAFEINDNVVQGLTAGLYALELEDTKSSASYLRRTLSSARRMMDDLVAPLSDEDMRHPDLVRTTASSLDDESPAPSQA